MYQIVPLLDRFFLGSKQFFLLIVAGWGGTVFFASASAQIRPDATLPNNSVVRPEGATSRIVGGTQAGSNLFHSFQQFDLATGSTAFFDQNPAIANIFARVTGGQPSSLDGVLRANGAASLFLINPRGILFGPNAQLNIGGSFLATTANSVLFPGGKVFRATPRTQSSPLLSIERPLGLAFNSRPGSITVQSQPGLAVQPGKTLGLLGGEISLAGGNLAAPGGRIELGALAANQQIRFDATALNKQQWGINYDHALAFRDIRITNLATVDASGLRGGDIQVQGRQVTLAKGGRLQALTLGNIDGGTIVVNATESLDLLGNLSLTSPIDPQFAQTGFFLPQKTTIFSTTVGAGQANSIVINTGTLRITNGADITAATDGLGAGGDLSINANKAIEVRGETVLLGFLEENIPFAEPITRNFLIDQTSVSQINARSAFIPNSGSSGDITIHTRHLTLRDGATLTAGSNSGPGGSITINATGTVAILGSTNSGLSTSNLATASISQNDALDLVIQANKLAIREGGVVTASTFGSGQAGNVVISTTESVDVAGMSRTGVFPSQINSGTFGTGNSGNIQIETPTFTVRDRGAIRLNSIAQGQTGSFRVSANSVVLANQGEISSNAVASPAGNLNIDTSRLILKDGSNITTNATGIEAGGNINLNTELLVALPVDGDSNITANAVNGPGGQITISTQGIFGIAVRDRPTRLNDITAISQNNPQLNGVVTINTPETDPSNNLSEQPEAVKSLPKIAQGCQTAKTANLSYFKHSGRGGLPTTPSESLSSLALWQDLRAIQLQPPHRLATTSQKEFPLATVQPAPDQIVEAQSWRQDSQGRILLTAKPRNPQGSTPWQPASIC